MATVVYILRDFYKQYPITGSYYLRDSYQQFPIMGAQHYQQKIMLTHHQNVMFTNSWETH